MDVRSMDRHTFTECYLTLPASGTLRPVVEVAALYERMCTTIVERGIQPVQEKLYGPLALRSALLAVRDAAFRRCGLDPVLPCTYVDGQPGVSRAVAGLQLWGIVPAPDGGVTVSTVQHPACGAGRVIRGDAFEALYLPHISDNGGRAGQDSPAARAERMFHLANDALRAHGYRYGDVVRTWIYLKRILDWYDDFNRVRNDFHVRQGLDGRSHGQPFPASTGIRGSGSGEECMMDLLAVRSIAGAAGVHVQFVLGSHRQRDAFAYGSGFSRAVSLTIEGRQTIFVSGTASIDRDGRTVRRGDPEGQVVETLLNVAAILEERGSHLRHIALGTVFCKDEETLAAYREVSRRRGLEDLPLIPVQADICRPDLRIEIEGVALAPSPRGARGLRVRE